MILRAISERSGLIGRIIIGLVNSVLSGIYAAAVYRYAAAGEMGEYFDEALIKNAFRRK